MAVVTKYGNAYKDPAAVRPVDAVFAEGVARKITSKASIANGDSIASIAYMGKVPSNALLSPAGNLYAPAIAGLTSVSLGFPGAASALMNAVNISAGGAFPAMSAVAVTNYTKRAWELAGLSADPGGMLDVILTLGAAAGAAGDVVLALPYSKTA